MPVLKSRVAAFDSIASAMVELLPSGSADREIAHQALGPQAPGLRADRAIDGEAFGDIDDLAVRAIIFEIGTLIRRARDIWQGNDRFSAVETNATTDPLVASAVEVEAIGSETIAEGANWSSSVIVATTNPLRSVMIAVVTVQVNHSASFEVVVNNGQNRVSTKVGVARDGIHVQGGIQVRQ